MVAQTLIALSSAFVAQASSAPADLEVGDALQTLVNSLGGLKGAGALAIAAFVVQAVLLFFRTKLAEFTGKWRLVIVTGLSLAAGLLALISAGVPWSAALVHANTLAALQVFGHQMFKQFTEKAK